MNEYKDFVFKGGWREYIEAVAEEISEDLAKELLWNIMIGCTGGEISSSHPSVTGFVNGCCLPFLEPPKLYWKKPSSELSKSALLVYLLMQEEGVEYITPTYIENWGLMRKGTASKAISELKEKGYLDNGELIFKPDKDIHWKKKETEE